MKMIREGRAEITVIGNGFLVKHNYPNCIAKPMYFKTLEDLFEFIKENVFCEVNLTGEGGE
jgi:hypothetical protein